MEGNKGRRQISHDIFYAEKADIDEWMKLIDVVQDDFVGGILIAEIAITRPHHATALRRATACPDRFVGQESAVKAGVVHHVAAHLVRTVGDAVRIVLVGRQQQQARRFDAVAGNHEGLAGRHV